MKISVEYSWQNTVGGKGEEPVVSAVQVPLGTQQNSHGLN